MSDLNEYLAQKRQALIERREHAKANGTGPNTLRASARVEGRSGVPRIRIRDFQIISDSGPDFAGYDLGSSSPELQLGVLGSCLTHVFLTQAADREVPLNSLEVEITAQIDPRSGQPGYDEGGDRMGGRYQTKHHSHWTGKGHDLAPWIDGQGTLTNLLSPLKHLSRNVAYVTRSTFPWQQFFCLIPLVLLEDAFIQRFVASAASMPQSGCPDHEQ